MYTGEETCYLAVTINRTIMDKRWKKPFVNGQSDGGSLSRHRSSSGSSSYVSTRHSDQDRHHGNGHFSSSSSFTRSSGEYRERYEGRSVEDKNDGSYRTKYNNYYKNNDNRENLASSSRYHVNWRSSRGRTHQDVPYFQRSHPRSGRSEDKFKSSRDNETRAFSSSSGHFKPSIHEGFLKGGLRATKNDTTLRGHQEHANGIPLSTRTSIPAAAGKEPEYGVLYGTDGQPREKSLIQNHPKSMHEGNVEIDKAKNRLVEYLPWLSSRKASISKRHPNEDLKEQLDGIELCLGLIQDIQSNVYVGKQSLNRAQGIILKLMSNTQSTVSWNQFSHGQDQNAAQQVFDYEHVADKQEYALDESLFSRRHGLPHRGSPKHEDKTNGGGFASYM